MLAALDESAGELTMWVSCQAPFRIRGEVARLLGLAEARVRVIAPDVGGGFGVKSGPLPRRAAAGLAGAPTRPAGEVDRHAPRGSDHHQSLARLAGEGALALDADGRITGLRAHIDLAARHRA